MNHTEMQETSHVILGRLEEAQLHIEQTAFDAINVTDRLVNLIDTARKCINSEEIIQLLDGGGEQSQLLKETIAQLLDNAFLVNNVAHKIEEEADFQHETLGSIYEIMDYLLSYEEEKDGK